MTEQTLTASQNGTAGDEGKSANDNVTDMLAHPSPIVSMVSKHSNGTLNLWQLTFADKTKFSQVRTSNKFAKKKF